MEAPIRVLRVVGRLDRGGLETIIMNAYRVIDRSKVQFDFIMHTTDEGHYCEEIRALGGRIFSVSPYNGKNHLSYIKEWKSFFEKNPEYKILHGHMMTTASIYLPIAKKNGLVTISHSHATKPNNKLIALEKYLLQFPLRKRKNENVDYMFACSKVAGQWLFGKKVLNKKNFKVIPNSIDVEKFKYNKSVREKMRNKLNISNQFVLGHIGRFDSGKNQKFIIEVFKEVLKVFPNSVLLLVGDGVTKIDIEKQVQVSGITEKVIFTGVRNDVECLVQAMDSFIFPSLFEGFGNVVIEAQSASLPCFVSTTVPKEVKVTNLVTFLKLENSPKHWAEKIVENHGKFKRIDKSQLIVDAGFDVKRTAKWYENFYLRNSEY